MKRRYFFFDIDGTLTDLQTRQIVPSALKTLQALETNGHFVGIATGRAHYKARPFMEKVGLHNMVCGGGGALVLHDTLICNEPLEHEKAVALCEEAERLGYGLLLALDDSIRVYAKDDRFREQVGERQEPTEYIFDATLDYRRLPAIYKIYIAVSQEEEHRLHTKDTLGHLRFVKPYLMFQHDDKKRGIERMMQYLQAPLEDVVVFGDDFNDMIMFDKQWTSIAMGNACEELKQKADYVTTANVEDGIRNACLHFGWITKEENGR